MSPFLYRQRVVRHLSLCANKQQTNKQQQTEREREREKKSTRTRVACASKQTSKLEKRDTGGLVLFFAFAKCVNPKFKNPKLKILVCKKSAS